MGRKSLQPYDAHVYQLNFLLACIIYACMIDSSIVENVTPCHSTDMIIVVKTFSKVLEIAPTNF